MTYTLESLELEKKQSLDKSAQYCLKARIAQLKLDSDQYTDLERQALRLQIQAWQHISSCYEIEAKLLEKAKGDLQAIEQEYVFDWHQS